jgi:hypothetical protein
LDAEIGGEVEDRDVLGGAAGVGDGQPKLVAGGDALGRVEGGGGAGLVAAAIGGAAVDGDGQGRLAGQAAAGGPSKRRAEGEAAGGLIEGAGDGLGRRFAGFGADAGGGAGAVGVKRAVGLGKGDGAVGQDRDKVGRCAGCGQGGGPFRVVRGVGGIGEDWGGKG